MAIWRGAGGSGDATTDAANEASVASTKATEAEASAAAAASSASSAATSATTATTKASEASSSATSAASSASSASTSASSALSSASLAATSATSADDSATAAATSETNAASSASSASTSATNASNSATAASTAQTAAETAQTNAETAETNAAASYDSFDDRYLGAKSSAPTLDNDGDALLTGALYWNTTSNQLFVWDGSAWDPAAFSTSGSVTSFNTRTGAVTLNSTDVNTALGSDAVLDSDIGTTVQAYSSVLANTTASYTTAEETKLAGIETGADVTNATNVTAAGALMDSEVTNLAEVKAFSSADYATAAQGTLADSAVQPGDSPSFAGLTVDTDTLAVDSTNNRVGIGIASPSYHLHVYKASGTSQIRTQSAGSTGTDIGRIEAQADSYVAQQIVYGTGEVYHSSNGTSHIVGVTSGTGTLRLHSGGSEAVRIDSSGNFGIGRTPNYKLDAYLSGTGSPAVASSNDNIVTILQSVGSSQGNVGTLTSHPLVFLAGNTERMRVNTSGYVGIGTTSPSFPLDVEAATGNVTARIHGGATAGDDAFLRIGIQNTTGTTGVYFGDSTTATVGRVNYEHSDDSIRIWANSQENVRVEADGDLQVRGDVVAYSTVPSDERLKDNIEVVESALDKVKQLRGVTFTYKENGKEAAGVIAQDVEKVLPEAVIEKELPFKSDDGKKYKVVQYDALHALMIEAIKELSDEVARLKRDN